MIGGHAGGEKVIIHMRSKASHTQRSNSEEGKLLALFALIDDPDAWYETLDYQQQILLHGWLTTGNRLFAKALLNKMLPKKVDEPVLVSFGEGFQNTVMEIGQPT